MTDAAAASRVLTLVFTDLADSMALKLQRGDQSAGELIARHRAHTSQLAAQGVGRIIDWAGDGCFLTFESPSAAVLFALRLQQQHGQEPDLPGVRVGMHLGEVSERIGSGGDVAHARVEGLAVDLAARICALARAGQVLMSPAVADSARRRLDGSSFARPVRWHTHGSYRVKGFDGTVEIREVGVEGVAPFVAPASASNTPQREGAGLGNLPAHSTSFVGREAEVAELLALTNAHRLVTLTGVGGVGKTRLALHVARQLTSDYPDGAWLVELALVSDPAAVADTAAAALGITPQASRSIAHAIAEALSGRRLLIVLDNCEHVLDAAADLVETLLARTEDVRIIATSREGLRVGAEHLWPLPSLDTRAGVNSSAVQLFMARAQAVKSGFTLANGADADAVTQICSRLDGIALAIELAAARMVSMSAPDLLARLTDRFRLLSGSRRGLERHQTLRQAMQWSYDLLKEDEKTLLNRCSAFAGGFDLQAASRICGGADLDEYAVLDVLDSLVRKSLVTAELIGGHMRYGLLETIRQFAEEQLAASGRIDAVRDRHARYFAERAVAYWEMWLGPQQRDAIDWADIEYANLRAGFRRAADTGQLDIAADIAAHTACLCFQLSRFEPTRWVEEILPAATQADIRRLPRLFVAAILATFDGRREAVPGYCRTALRLQDDPRYDPFDPAWGVFFGAILLFIEGGDAEESLAIFQELSSRPGLARAAGLSGMLQVLSARDRAAEARTMADDAVTAARAHGNPYYIAYAELGFARAHIESDQGIAQRALQSALSCAREHRLKNAESLCLRELALLEGLAGDVPRGLVTFDRVIDAYQRAGDQTGLRAAMGNLAVLLDRRERPEVAATLIGASQDISWPRGLPAARTHLREVLGEEGFAACVAAGAAMAFPAAARYAREQIALAEQQLAAEATADPLAEGVL